MGKDHPILHYIASSLFALTISLGVTGGVHFLLQDVARNPSAYFLERIPPAQFEHYLVIIAGVLFSVALSIVAYTVLLTRARVSLAVWNATHWLATSREQFRRVYDSAPIPYILLSADGSMHEPNKAALRFFGVPAEDIEGHNIFSFYVEEEPARIAQLRELYHRSVPINREEICIVTKDGMRRWVLFSVFEMRNPASASTTGLATLFDITEQKMLDQAKTEFVSLASHQLRTPLATTKWYMDMFRSGTLGELPEKQREYIERVYGVNEEMIELVDTLLNISRVDMGALPTESKPVNVQHVSESILEEMAPQIAKKDVRIQKQYGGLLEHVMSDRKLLRVVLHNLVSNAVKYTPNGGTVTIRFEDTAGVQRISVSDTGYGIPKAQQDRIFSKMFRADNVQKLPEQGTGLGLYLVKSIIERLGGQIHFISEENKGSTFTITL